MHFSMLLVSVGIILGKHNVEMNLTDDTPTYSLRLTLRTRSQLNFQLTGSQSHYPKYDLLNGEV